jgi:hypothetical protein
VTMLPPNSSTNCATGAVAAASLHDERDIYAEEVGNYAL